MSLQNGHSKSAHSTIVTTASGGPISGEPPVTTVATMLRSAAERHPAQVLAFLDARWDRVGALLGPGAEDDVLRHFFHQGDSLRLVAAMDAFAARHAPSMSRASLDKAEAVVRDRAGERARRIPPLDRWIAAAGARVTAVAAD